MPFKSVVLRIGSAIVLGVSLKAGIILQPVSVSSPQGSFSSSLGLPKMIDQSGLSAAYVSGATDFATYAAATTHNGLNSANSGFTNTGGGFPQTITFSFGSAVPLGGFAFWATGNIGSVTQFTLFGDSDNNFSNGTSGQLGGIFNTLANGGVVSPAQVFAFGAATAQFVHMRVLNTAGGTGLFPGVGEIAFDSTSVPEPNTVGLIGAGLVLVACLRRRGGSHS